MPTISSAINARLFHASEAIGYALWRDQLALHRNQAAEARARARTVPGIYCATVAYEAWDWACWVRGGVAAPQLDRVIGSAWDRGRAAVVPPGPSAPSRPSPVTPEADKRPDIERYDLGRAHRRMALWLGGSDAAVLAPHVGFFALRMLRHGVVGTITAVGLAAGGLYGATITGPAAVWASRGPLMRQPTSP